MASLLRKKFNLFVFFLFTILIFIAFRQLFGYYFEADEWFHFTYYFPLTRKPDGFLTAVLSTFTNAGSLSAGQHVIPVASAIYFLNTKFFGLSYSPYAFASLFLHSINTFLVFLFVKSLLAKKDKVTKNVFATLSSIFFAFSPTPMHVVTGAAPFYGQNILSVTFFLLCIIFFKKAFLQGSKKFIYLSIIFLFLSLFTKETSIFLFALLPFMALLEKRDLPSGSQVFPLKFLVKIFLLSIVVYAIFRFLIPNVHSLPERIMGGWIDSYISQPSSTPIPKTADTGTIVSQDLSIYKNLPEEILFRSVTFPLRMIGTLFFPRQSVFSIVEFITPAVSPEPPGGERLGQLGFLYGAGNYVVIYLMAFGILIFCGKLYFRFVREKKVEESRALLIGFVIIILSALPLVAIIFSFPRWGYDFYFDSRFYYNPNVGAAIIFPFLLFGIARFFSRLLRLRSISLIVLILFIIWLINNMYVFEKTRAQFINRYGSDRRELINQLKNYLPALGQKTVFFVETDSKSAYGPSLPFQTSVPQAITIVYYDNSPLPGSFFDKPLFDGRPQGYLFSEGWGFGYYTSKKDLRRALLFNSFSVDDVYGFYYYAEKVKLKDITPKIRKEMRATLNEKK